MNFKIHFNIDKSGIDLKHGDDVILLGSCFSDSMSGYFENSGFKVLSNPFGTLFHPLAISKALQESISPTDSGIFQRDDLFFSWLASGNIYASSKDEMSEKLISAQSQFVSGIEKAKLLVITFGSAWGYHRNKEGIVANCHKQPQIEFEKLLTDTDELIREWNQTIEKIQKINPDLTFIFTVSPVRHLKDGLIDNNRSKSRLIELSHALSKEHGSYFPSYEIIIDELRDYRFFKNDLVHPTKDATAYVWDRFCGAVLSNEAQELRERVERVNATLAHKSLYPESIADQKRLEKSQVQRTALQKEFPEIYWK